jgi:hypothetical protein
MSFDYQGRQPVGRLGPTGVSRQFAPAGAERGVGLRFANPTYPATRSIRGRANEFREHQI